MRARRFVLVVMVCGGCSFDPGGVGPGGDDDPSTEAAVWRLDSFDELADGASLDAAVLEPWGAIGPAAWMTGGLLARASDAQLFDDLDVSWDVLAAADPDGWGITRLVPRDYGLDRPRGVALTGSDTWTYWADGEIWLEAGAHTVHLTADDQGFIELAAPGTEQFVRVVGADYTEPVAGDYQAVATGWHPIRIAVAEGLVDAALEIRVAGPGDDEPAPVAPDRLRFRADGATGLTWLACDDRGLLAPVDEFFFRGPLDYAPDGGDVTELGLSDSERFSMRWAGQVRIDAAGDHAFRIESDDGHRLWIDGALVSDAWDDTTHDRVTEPLALAVGWHDLVVDLSENTGDQALRLSIADGPAGAGEVLAADRLRPVAPRRERVAGAVRDGATIPDQGEVTLGLDPGAPAGAVALGVELTVTIDHPLWSDLSAAVIAPGGAVLPLIAAGESQVEGEATLRASFPVGGDADGDWLVRVADTAARDRGEVTAVALTVRHAGGEPPIATRAVYDSAVRELGDAVVAIDEVAWDGTLPDGAEVQVRVRTCDQAAACAAEPWSAPVTAPGGDPGVPARRFAQLRVELLSDGDAVGAVDWIELRYTR